MISREYCPRAGSSQKGLALSRSRCALAVAVVALAASPPTAARAQVQSITCTVFPGARCGLLDVPMDPSGGVPGPQRLGFAVLPATGAPTGGTLAVLAGGPGQAATPVARSIAKALAPVRADHDLLLLDQRGTGLSGRLECASLASRLTPATLRACANALGARRQFLTTRADAYDLEAVRDALGLDRISLLGISYGTGVAGYYARLFPQHVDRVILDSPEPIEGPDALDTLRQLALPRVLREVCWPPSCRSFLASNPITGIATPAAKLRKKSLRGYVVSPSGKRVSAHLTSTALYALTAVSDLDPFLRTRMPSAIAAALRGDAAPLLRLALGVPTSDVGSDKEFNPIRLLATSCVEDRLPWDPASPLTGRVSALTRAVLARPASTWSPFSPTAVLSFSSAAVCAGWPSTPKPAGVSQTGPNVPVLVVSGRDDLRTPLEDARRTASQYPNAQVLAIPDTGHSAISSDPTSCAIAGVTAFLSNQPVAKCTREQRQPNLFPYVPGNARNLKRVPGLPGIEGRTATAVGATIYDAMRQADRLVEAGAHRVGGLRAGTLTLTRTAVKLKGYSIVNGITVTGTIPVSPRATGTLLVAGPDAAPATLKLHGTQLTGQLGADRVKLRVVLPTGG